ncbi:MAG: hypothetical protein D8M58_06200 [Calditrichaeota bacterium]|nr:MAG: hypothetical protein DWQ03_20305 [Calditrichota bacterium]MBL1204971.1 hypothetical protein [Calditrichota bacterium]NOG44801.1 hypothetical protein [Calditrichota bacterium]
MKNIFSIFIVLLISSCDNSKRIFENIDITPDNLKICVFPFEFDLGDESCALPLENGILLDNQSTIRTILENWEYHDNTSKSFPKFKLFVLKDNVPQRSFSFNKCLDKLNTSFGSYDFNPNDLLKYKDFFKPLIGLDVQFKTLNECRKFNNIIKNEAFVFIEGIDSVFIWEKYKGTVKIKKEYFENFPGLDVKDLIYEELKSNEKFEMVSFKNIESERSIIIELVSNNSIHLPKSYSILEDFQEFRNISFKFIGVNKERANKIAEDNNIKIHVIKEVQF